MSHRHASYLCHIFSGVQMREDTINRAVEKLRRIKDRFDAIVVTGVSGTTFGAMIAARLKKQLVVVRKDTGDCHSVTTCEGLAESPQDVRYLFVDDLMCSGKTTKRVFEEVKDQNYRAKCVGFYMYYTTDQISLTPQKAWDKWQDVTCQGENAPEKPYFALDKSLR